MGQPGDVGRFRDVVEILRERGLCARRVRVGSIEVEFTPPPSETHPSVDLTQGEAHLTPEEEEAEARREYERVLYGASEGVDN